MEAKHEEIATARPVKDEPPPHEPGKEATPKGRAADKEEKGFVRVVSDSLNRLMGYAGECLVQAKSAKPFSASFLKIKENHMEVVSGLENLQGTAKAMSLPKEIEERLGEYLKKLDRMHDFLGSQIVDFDLFSRSLERLADKLYEEVVAIRMRPFSDGVSGFPRMVRDLAKSMGKKVDFQIIGDATRVDRDMLEKLEAPLGPPPAQRRGPRCEHARRAARDGKTCGSEADPGGPARLRHAPREA